MREPKPDYFSSQYQRPNQPWVCGLASEGHACPAGPSARGHCPALAECAPVRNGDRWVCNRSDIRGGLCDNGPTPEGGCGCVQQCRPVRSLRAIRGRFIAACTMLAAGGLMIALSANWRDRVITPGPLAQQHAQLLEKPGAEANCAACHAAARQSVAGWSASLLLTADDQPTQSQLCLNCHAKTIATKYALSPHNLPETALRRITDSRDVPRVEQVSMESMPHELRGDVACAVCHREHHGARVDLTAIDDTGCQTCHQKKFESFAADHPDFGIWPYERRTRIAFNHASHLAKHFVDKKQAFDCRACHVSDSTGTVEKLANYETACASCHDEKIETSVSRGVAMLVVPTLDVDALKKAGHDIGPWPEAATGDFDGRLPPIMKLLLAADRDGADAIKALGSDFEFQDVDPDDPIHLKACADLAAVIKSLFANVGQRGPAAVRERLSKALAPYATERDMAPLIAGLSVDTMRGAASWLPGVDFGSAAWPRDAVTGNKKPGGDVAKPRSPEGAAIGERPQYDPAGTWFRDDATLSIRYRPEAHADPVMTSWLELLASTPHLEMHPVAMAMFKELSHPTAPGLCVSCHSVEQTEPGKIVVNWRAYDRTTEPRSFTKFSHGPHLVLPQLEDCTKCHAIDDAANTTASYVELDPHQFISEFRPVSKRQCAECHTKAAAGDKCQSCHNYHVEGSDNWKLDTTRLIPDFGGQRAECLDSAFRPPPSTFD